MSQMIDTALANNIAARHGLTPSAMPTWGVRVYDAGRDYLFWYREPDFVAFDVTVYDSGGGRVDPDISEWSGVHLWIDSIVEGVRTSIPQIGAIAGLGVAALIAFMLWRRK